MLFVLTQHNNISCPIDSSLDFFAFEFGFDRRCASNTDSDLLAIDTASGRIVWSLNLGPLWAYRDIDISLLPLSVVEVRCLVPVFSL